MTKLLAIETTGLRGSVACAERGKLLTSELLRSDQRSAQSLIPAIESILKSRGWVPADLDGIAVAVGPGSFTGLRVGVTTAKVLAWACGAALYGIDSLEAAAWTIAAALPAFLRNAPENPVYAEVLKRGAAFVSVALSAQRGDVASRGFLIRLGENRPIPRDESFRLEPLTDWIGRRSESAGPDGPLPLLYAGPPLASKRFKEIPAPDTAFLPEPFGTPSADGVALAASAASPADPFTLLPIYSRDSAAEEKRKMAK